MNILREKPEEWLPYFPPKLERSSGWLVSRCLGEPAGTHSNHMVGAVQSSVRNPPRSGADVTHSVGCFCLTEGPTLWHAFAPSSIACAGTCFLLLLITLFSIPAIYLVLYSFYSSCFLFLFFTLILSSISSIRLVFYSRYPSSFQFLLSILSNIPSFHLVFYSCYPSCFLFLLSILFSVPAIHLVFYSCYSSCPLFLQLILFSIHAIHLVL